MSPPFSVGVLYLCLRIATCFPLLRRVQYQYRHAAFVRYDDCGPHVTIVTTTMIQGEIYLIRISGSGSDKGWAAKDHSTLVRAIESLADHEIGQSP